MLVQNYTYGEKKKKKKKHHTGETTMSECTDTTYKGTPSCKKCRHYGKESCPYFGLPVSPTDFPCPDFEHKNWRIPRKVRYFFKHYDNLVLFKKVIEERLGLEAHIVRGKRNYHYLLVIIPKDKKIWLGRFYAKAKNNILILFYIKNWRKTWRPLSVSDVERQLSDEAIMSVLSRLGVSGKVVKVLGCQKPLLPKIREMLARKRIEYLNYTHKGLSVCLRAFFQRIIWKKAGRLRYCPRCGQGRIFLKFRKRPTCPSCGYRPFMSRWLMEPPILGTEADLFLRQK